MPKTVLLTGISGFIGLHCAKELLKCGFKVRGTIRNPNKKKVVCESLTLNKEEAKRIDFSLLDLTSDNGWDVAMNDCTYVMHVASPFRIANPKNANDFFKPAIEGTERVLRYAQHAGVKRIILTSSIVSMMSNLKTGQFSPDDWTDLSYRNLSTYIKSKTLAERLAWDFVNKEEKTIQNEPSVPELVVIAPGGVFGPPLGKDLSAESLSVLSKMLSGKMPLVPNTAFPMVDVRDVAKLHVKAMLKSDAAGERFIAAGKEPVSFADVAKILQKAGYKGPSARKIPSWIIKLIATFDLEARGMVGLLDKHLSADNKKTRDFFDWRPIPFEQSVIEMASAIKTIENKKQ